MRSISSRCFLRSCGIGIGPRVGLVQRRNLGLQTATIEALRLSTGSGPKERGRQHRARPKCGAETRNSKIPSSRDRSSQRTSPLDIPRIEKISRFLSNKSQSRRRFAGAAPPVPSTWRHIGARAMRAVEPVCDFAVRPRDQLVGALWMASLTWRTGLSLTLGTRHKDKPAPLPGARLGAPVDISLDHALEKLLDISDPCGSVLSPVVSHMLRLADAEPIGVERTSPSNRNGHCGFTARRRFTRVCAYVSVLPHKAKRFCRRFGRKYAFHRICPEAIPNTRPSTVAPQCCQSRYRCRAGRR